MRGDDGVGWQAAILLARELKDQVQVLARHQLTPELAEALSTASASYSSTPPPTAPPAKSRVTALSDPSNRRRQPFTHHVAPPICSQRRTPSTVTPPTAI
ncbi:MAG: hypothetical protein R2856_01000 [Caldilineaceae bacterium]